MIDITSRENSRGTTLSEINVNFSVEARHRINQATHPRDTFANAHIRAAGFVNLSSTYFSR